MPLTKLSRYFRRRPGSTPAGKLTREHVVWAYRLFLDREPEGEACINGKLSQWTTTRELRGELLSCQEFQGENPGQRGHIVESNVVIKELDHGMRIFVDLADTVIGQNVLFGRYEPAETAFVRDTVESGQVVLDIGGNIGYFTLLLRSMVGTTGHVFTFEPLPQNADLLERSIAENDLAETVTLHRKVVGAGRGSGKLVFLEVERAQNSGGAYLLPPDGAVPPDHRTEDIEIISLDTTRLKRPVRFIKIDVEGAEPLVFRGAEALLREDKPTILAEINPTNLETVSGASPTSFISQMAAYGFTCHRLYQGRLGEAVRDVEGRGISSVVFKPAGPA